MTCPGKDFREGVSAGWRTIWQKRPMPRTSPTLAELVAIDGHDGFGGIEESAWLAYADRVATKLAIQIGDSIYEVGCGAGAFLYPWHVRGHRVGGMDYAENLVRVARLTLRDADIISGEAVQLDPSAQYDFVMAQGVFFYFPDFDYAADVLKKMILKARKAVAILDVPDLALKEQSLKFRRGDLGAEEYESKYVGLDHLYFSRSWFVDILRDINLTIRIEDQDIAGYAHNPYRFNVFINKVAAPR